MAPISSDFMRNVIIITLSMVAPLVHSLGCPSFSCPDPDQCSLTVNGGLASDGPGKFSATSVTLDGDPINNPGDCCNACKSFAPVCTYWTYAIQSNGEGICYMYTTQICDPSNGDVYTPCQQADMAFTGNNMTTGKICPEAGAAPPGPIGIVGDPHFTGADGSQFDFTGVPNKTYCVLSDSHIHVNAYLGGRFGQWGSNPHKALTWIRQVAILWGHHSIYLAAREGPEWAHNEGFVSSISVDGKQIQLDRQGATVVLFDGKVSLTWLLAGAKDGGEEVDVYEVNIEGVLGLILRVRPEIAMLRTAEDGVVHFDLQVSHVSLSAMVHGILGQTYRADHTKRLFGQKMVYSNLMKRNVVDGDNAEGFIDGVVSDYETSSIVSADCAMSRFSRAERVDLETAQAIETSIDSSVMRAAARKLLGRVA